MTPRYDIEVRLSGTDGNAFAIISKVRQALKNADVDAEIVEQFTQEAMAGDYDNVLMTCMRYVQVT